MNWMQREIQGMRAALAFGEPIEPGLHTYPVTRSDGSQKRLHLRVETSGRGILFVDVTDVILITILTRVNALGQPPVQNEATLEFKMRLPWLRTIRLRESRRTHSRTTCPLLFSKSGQMLALVAVATMITAAEVDAALVARLVPDLPG